MPVNRTVKESRGPFSAELIFPKYDRSTAPSHDVTLTETVVHSYLPSRGRVGGVDTFVLCLLKSINELLSDPPFLILNFGRAYGRGRNQSIKHFDFDRSFCIIWTEKQRKVRVFVWNTFGNQTIIIRLFPKNNQLIIKIIHNLLYKNLVGLKDL